MPQAIANHTHEAPPATACGDVVEFNRLNYFHGRALGALDLRREQAYHLDKDRLRNRLLHGWGIVCGLEVTVAEKTPCDPADDAPNATVVVVHPGAAIDCRGNEIVVRNPREIVLNDLLSPADLKAASDGHPSVYLTLAYHEQPIDPTRPLLAADCEPIPDCRYGRICETYRICASTTRPDPGPSCEPCCGGCTDTGLLLAEIEDFNPDYPVQADQIELADRRPLARHDLTEIVGINWVHGATYTREAATALFASSGIKVRFSRPIQVASLRPHVVELTTIEGGGGRNSGVYVLAGEFPDPPVSTWDELPDGERVERPDARLTRDIVYTTTSDETLQYGDHVVITIRGDFVIDECCRAIDANHAAGSVPRLRLDDDTPSPSRTPVGPLCPARRSGNGTEGGDFVSWIFVEKRKKVAS